MEPNSWKLKRFLLVTFYMVCLYLRGTHSQDPFTVTSSTDSITVTWPTDGTWTNLTVEMGVTPLQCDQDTSSSTCVLPNLTPGSGHLIKITQDGTIAYEETHYTIPNPPGPLSVSFTDLNTVVSWSAGTDNDADVTYEIVLNGVTHTANKDATQVNLDLLSPGAGYTVKVWSVAGEGTLQKVNSSSSADAAGHRAPNPPDSVSVSFTASNTVVDWSAGTGNAATGVTYEIQLNEGTPVTSATSPANLPPISPGASYTVKVWSVVGDEKSTTFTDATGNRAPNPPDSVSVSFTASNTVVDWSAGTGNAATGVTYEIQLNEGTPVTSATSPANLPPLSPGASYTVKVWSVAGDEKSTTFTDATGNRVPNPPGSVNVNFTASNTVVSWTAGAGNDAAVTYEIQLNEGTPVTSVTSPANLPPISPGASYTVKVWSVAGDEKSASSTDATGNRAPLPPTGVTLTKSITDATQSLEASWTPDSNNAAGVEYRIRLDKGATPGTVLESGTVSSHTFNNLVPGGGYKVYVWTFAGGTSDEAEESTKINSATAYTKPKPPTGVTLVSANGVTDRLTASWTAATNPANDAAVRYEVVLYEGNTERGRHTANATSTHEFESLSAATQYNLKGWAFVQGQVDEKSEEIPDSAYTAPSQPAITAVTAESTKDLRVTWTHLTGVSYDVKIYKDNMPQVTKIACDNIATSPCSIDVITEFTSATPGQKYVITLVAIAGDGTTTSTASAEVKANTKPKPPESLTVVTRTTTSLVISWSIPSDTFSSGYNSSISPSLTGVTKVIDTNNRSLTVTGLQSGHLYEITVYTVSGNAQSSPATASFHTKPPQVAQPSKSAVSQTAVTISWTKPTGNFSKYEIVLRSGDTDTGTNNVDEDAETLQTTFTSLTAGHDYTVIVRTVITESNSEIKSDDSPSLTVNAKPQVPGNLALIKDGRQTNSLNIEWSAPANGMFDNYRVQRGSLSVVTVTKAVTTHEFDSLTSGTSYSLKLWAVNGDQSSDEVEQSYFTVPKQPASLSEKTTDRTTSSVTVEWTEPSGGAYENYKLIISKRGTALETQVYRPANTVSHKFTNRKAGTVYDITIAATVDTNAVESSAISTVAISKPNPPGTQTVSEPKQETQFTMTWEHPLATDQVDGYDWRVRLTLGSADIKSGSTTSRSATVGSLTPGTTYSFLVKAKTTSGGKTAYSTEVSSPVTLKPATPSSLREGSTGKSTDTLYVEWNSPPVGKADSYRVEWKLKGTSIVLGQQTEDSGTTSTISGLLAGRTYTVTVYARSNDVEGDGHSADFTTLPSSEVALTVMDADISVDSIKVTWNQPTNSFFSMYRLRISPNDGNEILPLDIQKTSNRTYTFDLLTPGREYTLSIALVSSGAEGAQRQKIVTTLPRMVENLAGQTQSIDTIRLTWSILADSLQDVFEITYANGQTMNVPYQSSITSYQKDIISLSAGETYTFTVRSKSGDRYSAPESVTQTTLPGKVTTITATTQSPHSVQVTWVPDTNSIQDSYLISYKGEFVETSSTEEISVTDTAHLFENLYPGERYTFKVKPVSNSEIGADNTAIAVTTPYNPQGLKVSTLGILPERLTIEWQYDDTLSYNTGWRVTYTPDGADVIVAEENLSYQTLFTTISNLIPGQHYTLMVQGRTVDNVINTTGIVISATTKPVLVSNVEISDTTTTTMTVIYNEDASGNVFDDYIFTLGAADAENMTKIKAKEDMGREILFDSLVPGTVYTLTAIVQSGTEKSDAQIMREMTVPPTPTLVCQELRNDYITVRVSHQTGLVDNYMVNCDQCAVASQTVNALPGHVDVKFEGLLPFVDHTFIGIAKRNDGDFNKASSMGQEICKTEESVPHAVENFIHNDETLKPYEVTLTWDDPSVSTGVLTEFFLEWSGTKANRPPHETQRMELDDLVHTTTVDNLRAGYNYNFTIKAAVSKGAGAPRSINVVMPILEPFIELPEEQARPTVAEAVGEDDKPLDWNQVRVVLTNPFSNRDSEVVSFSVIIIDVTDNPPASSYEREIQESWYDIQNSDLPSPYKAFDKCTTLFSDGNDCLSDGKSPNRQKRLVDPGAQTTITLGSDSKCKDKKASVNYCNGPLRGETRYRILLRGYNEIGEFTNGYISREIITQKQPLNIILVIVPILVVLVLVVVAVTLFILHRRGKLGKKNDPQPINGDILTEKPQAPSKKRIKVSRAVKVADFPDHFRKMSADSDFKFAEEYEDLKPVGRDQSFHISELPANRVKNRFTNILPYDHSRVKLLPTDEEEGLSDYINANWMPGYNSKREFIVTQGPLPSTRDDFWRMIWEYNCRAIVMLTRCVEKGREKCDHYWPVDSEPMYYGDLQVAITDEVSEQEYTISKLQIAQGEQVRRLTHFHYLVWPDFGVPETPNSLIRYVKLVRKQLSYEGGPIVVHCSAGVGRSGTYICLDRLFQTIEEHDEVDVYGIVHEMRLSRPLMVQTEKQYIFIHECLMCVVDGRENDDLEGEDNDAYEPENIYVNQGGW